MDVKQKIMLPIFVIFILTFTSVFAMAASKPEISNQTSQYIDRGISINLQWQSPNPVTRVLVYAGSGEKEVKVDEYDNRRNPYGYEGEVTVIVPVDPSLYQGTIPYQIQLEDDLRIKSDLFSGRVKLPVATAPGMTPVMPGMMPGMAPGMQSGQPGPTGEDGWGKSNIRIGKGTGQTADGKPNDMVDKLIKVAERFDTPPTLEAIKVNVLGPDNVSFSSRANDDKGIKEIAFRVFDNQGNKIGEQLLSNLGKTWEGSCQPIKTGGGSFVVIAQAIDSTGNTSKEQRATFTMSGAPIQPQPAAVTTPVEQPATIQTPVDQTPVATTPGT